MEQTGKRSFLQAIALSVVSVIMVNGCSGGQGPFLQLQLCVANSGGVERFKAELKSIARDERLRYIDGSGKTTQELKLLKPNVERIHTDGRLVNVGVEADGYGLAAGNLGLNPYQIAVGFGPDTRQARLFADRVVTRLERHWRLSRAPSTSGVLPDPSCGAESATPPNNSSKPTPLRGAA